MTDESVFRNVLDHINEGVYFVDNRRRITYWSGGAERITGYNRAEVEGRSCLDRILMHVNHTGEILCNGLCPLAATMLDGKQREAEIYLHHKDGHRLPISVRVTPIRSLEGNILGAVEIFSDNSFRLSALEKIDELEKLSLVDTLTGIGNRRYTEMCIEASLNEFYRHQFTSGLLFIDIDHFKQVNDTYGHATGDEVLRMVANTLRSNLKSFDYIGRWGGEEFIVLLANVDESLLWTISERLHMLVSHSVLYLESGEIRVTISLGATLSSSPDNPTTWVERADKLMYISKTEGRDRITLG